MDIYLDNAATTKPIADVLSVHAQSEWYNPSASYPAAEKVFISIERTRRLLMKRIGIDDGGCVMTSGGTEANNIGIMSSFKPKGHYITSTIEHPSVYSVFAFMEKQGAAVDYIKPKGFCIEPQDVADKVRENTLLVSVMHVNNETGAKNDMAGICAAVKAKNNRTLIHSDGVQALNKTQVNLTSLGVDAYSISAHKIHGLKGTGALLYRKGVVLKPLLFGGEQQNNLRAGTENTIGIQSLDAALRLGVMDIEHASKLHKMLIEGLSTIPGVVINLPEKKVPHILSVCFEGIRAQVLVRQLGSQGIYIGAGAACSRGKVSRTLIECGVSADLAEGAVRISLCKYNTQKEIEIFLDVIRKSIKQLRLV